MSARFSKVKYSLYNSESIQAESDDEVSIGSESNFCNLNSTRYISRKAETVKGDTKIELEEPVLKKSFEESEHISTSIVSIHRILREENPERIQHLLDNLSLDACQLSVNQLDEHRRAPLHYAARYNLVAATKLLLKKGADVNIKGEDGLTPLHFAARYAYIRTSKHLNVQDTDGDCHLAITVLIEEGANVICQDNYGMTPLHYAAIRGNTFAAEELLKSKQINTEISDNQEMTALHCAANYNSPDVAELLLNAGAHPEAVDENCSTPLHLAATTGSKEIIIFLLDAVSKNGDDCDFKKYIEEKNLSGNAALHLAIIKGHLDIVKILLDKGADAKVALDNGSHPLHLAAMSGNIGIAECLLEHGAPVSCINNSGETPLHKAAAFNASKLIEFLLENGADKESYDNAHFTPLLIAVAGGRVEAVKTLLKWNANLDVLDNMDRSVVFWAAQKNYPVIFKTLLENESTKFLVNRCDHYDNSPLHVAALKGFTDISEMLLENGAEIEQKNEHEQTPLHLAARNGHACVARVLLKHTKTIVNAEDENANTPLHLAALHGHISVINVLLNAGANFEARNCYLWTPLGCAAKHGWKRSCQVLLNAGSQVNTVDKSKATPLHLAAQEGHRGIVKLLLKHNADISQLDKNGRNCLDLAIKEGYEEVAMEILSDSKWEEALRNEFDDDNTFPHQTPLRNLIRHMPDVAEYVLDQCIVPNDYPEDHPKFSVTFNYEFLDDSFACYKHRHPDNVECNCTSSKMDFLKGANIYDKKGCVNSKAVPYETDKEILICNHPLMLMVTSGQEGLLSHPLCESLLRRKWKYYGRYVYYSNLLIFFLFLIFLTGFVVTAVPPCPLAEGEEDPKCCSDLNYTCQPFFGKCDIINEKVFPEVCRIFIYLLAVIHLMKEIYQIHQNGIKYLNLENLLEWACYLSALIFVADFNECSAETGIRQPWQWELGSLSIFSAWMVLVMFISKFPFLGIYVIMFLQILSTFVNFSLVFFLFIVAFALGFFTVLQNQNPFESPGESIIKTSVMMIGEIEYDGIFNDPENKLYFKGPTYTLFIVFLLIMAVIIVNLLIGLAVDDIKGVKEKAELKRLAMKVELVLTVERILPVVVLRKCLFKYRTTFPNSWKSYPWYMRFFQDEQTLPTTYSKSPLEVLEEKQDKINKQMKELQESIFQIQKDVKHILTNTKSEKGS